MQLTYACINPTSYSGTKIQLTNHVRLDFLKICFPSYLSFLTYIQIARPVLCLNTNKRTLTNNKAFLLLVKRRWWHFASTNCPPLSVLPSVCAFWLFIFESVTNRTPFISCLPISFLVLFFVYIYVQTHICLSLFSFWKMFKIWKMLICIELLLF